MTKHKTPEEVVHTLPADMKKVINTNPEVLSKWNSLTPLARNEWICWTTIVKKEETRKEHIVRMREDLLTGKRDRAVGQDVHIEDPVQKNGFLSLRRNK